jgi:hypothetical protein
MQRRLPYGLGPRRVLSDLMLQIHRFCGIETPHYSHTFYRDRIDVAGSANYECPGWTYQNAFQEVKEWHGEV